MKHKWHYEQTTINELRFIYNDYATTLTISGEDASTQQLRKFADTLCYLMNTSQSMKNVTNNAVNFGLVEENHF